MLEDQLSCFSFRLFALRRLCHDQLGRLYGLHVMVAYPFLFAISISPRYQELYQLAVSRDKMSDWLRQSRQCGVGWERQ